MDNFEIGNRIRVVRGSYAYKFGTICQPLPYNKRDSSHIVNGGTAWVLLEVGKAERITVTLPKSYLQNLTPKLSIKHKVPPEFSFLPESTLRKLFRGL